MLLLKKDLRKFIPWDSFDHAKTLRFSEDTAFIVQGGLAIAKKILACLCDTSFIIMQKVRVVGSEKLPAIFQRKVKEP